MTVRQLWEEALKLNPGQSTEVVLDAGLTVADIQVNVPEDILRRIKHKIRFTPQQGDRRRIRIRV